MRAVVVGARPRPGRPGSTAGGRLGRDPARRPGPGRPRSGSAACSRERARPRRTSSASRRCRGPRCCPGCERRCALATGSGPVRGASGRAGTGAPVGGRGGAPVGGWGGAPGVPGELTGNAWQRPLGRQPAGCPPGGRRRTRRAIDAVEGGGEVAVQRVVRRRVFGQVLLGERGEAVGDLLQRGHRRIGGSTGSAPRRGRIRPVGPVVSSVRSVASARCRGGRQRLYATAGAIASEPRCDRPPPGRHRSTGWPASRSVSR